MTDYRAQLLAGVPSPDDNADVPKALKVFAGAIGQSLDAHDANVDRLARELDGAGIRAQVKRHHVLWGIMVQGGEL